MSRIKISDHDVENSRILLQEALGHKFMYSRVSLVKIAMKLKVAQEVKQSLATSDDPKGISTKSCNSEN